MDPRIGTDLGPYRVEALIGRGGMGVVYVAEHATLGRKVALKVLPPELTGDEEFGRRFQRESRLAASLAHPNIVPVYEAGEAGGALYIAMQYVRGRDLGLVLRDEGRMEWGRALGILGQVADALDEAHAEGLIHRDVKPANILLAPGRGGSGERVYLTDFGLARRLTSETRDTRSGHFVGTLDYLPPELLRGEDPDARSDVYALGCVVYECLTGRIPFDRPHPAAVGFAHLQDPPPRVTDERPDLPAAVDGVVARAMAKDRADRQASAGEVVAGLRSSVGEAPAPPKRPPDTTPHPAPPRARTSRWLLAAAAGVLLGVGAVLLLLLRRDDTPQTEPSPAVAEAVAGTWEATDTTDGSDLRLEISAVGESRYVLRLVDDRVSAICPGESVTTNGIGTLRGDTITADMSGLCSPSRTPFEVEGVRFTYRASTDTLTDNLNPGTVWSQSA